MIVTSGRPLREDLPDGAKFWSKPWAPLDVIREAERVAYERGIDDGGEPRRAFVTAGAWPRCFHAHRGHDNG